MGGKSRKTGGVSKRLLRVLSKTVKEKNAMEKRSHGSKAVQMRLKGSRVIIEKPESTEEKNKRKKVGFLPGMFPLPEPKKRKRRPGVRRKKKNVPNRFIRGLLFYENPATGERYPIPKDEITASVQMSEDQPSLDILYLWPLLSSHS